MNILSVNLEQKLIKSNRRALANQTALLTMQDRLDQQVEKLRLGAEASVQKDRDAIIKELGFDYKVSEATKVKETNQRLAHLPQDRIFHIDSIRKLCTTYGLRFLETCYYKGELDAAIPSKVEDFKALDAGKNSEYDGTYQYYIAAPASSFVLQDRPKDPLLFARLGYSNHYYLVHKWENDLSLTARLFNQN